MPAAPPLWSETEEIPQWEDTTEIVDERPTEREPATFVEPPPMPEMLRPSVGATGTWEDESGIPPEIGPEQTRRIRAGVDLLAARLQGDKEQREAESLGEQYRSIERFTPAGILNQPERIARAIAAPDAPEVPERFQPGEAIFPIPEPKGTSAMAGLGQLGVQTLNSLQTPEMIVTAPAAANPVGRALFAGDMGRHIPEQVEQGAQVIGDIETTPAQKVVAGGTPVIAGTMTALLGKSEIPRPAIVERTIAKTEAAVPGALNKSVEALKKTSEPADAPVVEAKVEPVGERRGGTPPREAPPAPVPVEAKADTLAADVAREQAIAVEREALAETIDPMTADQNPRWMELNREMEGIKNRYGGRTPSTVPKDSPTKPLIERLEDAIKNGKSVEGNASGNAREFGKTLTTAEDIAALKTEHARNESEYAQALEALGDNPTDAQISPIMLEHGMKGQWINEAIDGATGAWEYKMGPKKDTAKFRALREAGKPINEKAIPATTEAAPTTAADQTSIQARQAPVAEPGVGAVPENVSGTGAQTQTATGSGRVDPAVAPAKPIAGETIRAAALRAEDGTIYTGKWHPAAYEELMRDKGLTKEQAIQQQQAGKVADGFLTSSGRFVSREEAAKIASKADQFRPDKEGDIAFAGALKQKTLDAGPGRIATAKTQLGAAESKLAEVVNRSIEQAPSAARPGVSPAATMRPTDVVLGAPDLRSISPAVEARWQQAVKGTESIIDKVKTHADEAWKSISREYADLPPREFPAEIDVLRRLRASRNASARTTVDVLKGITHNMGQKQYGVFNRVALLEDLVKDVESGKYSAGNDLPFGYKDAGELTADLNKFRAVSEATPQIKAALERRQEFMDSMRSTLVERGFLPESVLQDPRYFHHQVLLYMAEKNAPSGSRSFRDWFSGWQKKRTGSSKDYNRQYVESEAEVLSDAFNKIAMQDLQGEMRGIADLTAELKNLHGEQWREHIPKTHTLWQPKQGNAFYPVQTVAERVMDRYLSGLGEILPSEFKEALAMGARKQEWVVPKPLAKVLDNIAPRPDNWISRLATTAQNSWKRYILLNPLRAAKYNLNNLSGDLDFLFAAQPKIFKEFKSSASDMWGFHVKGKSAVGDIKEAMQDGVIGSGWRASELPDIARSDYFSWLTGEKPKLTQRYWDKIGKLSDAREDTGRMASYRFAKKEWEAGRPFYGASVPADVNALATPRLKAAKVAREILIDYGRGTEFSNFTRQKVVPFFKWMEGNFVRYQRLIRNVPEHEGAGPRVAGLAGKKAATLGLRMGAAYGIINLWNHMFFPKEEEELGEGRNQLHLILGRDDQGNIQTIRFQGALSDLLGWVGGEDLPQDVQDLATGKASVGDKMEDAYEAGISRAVNASLPFPKTAAEIGLGRSFYPNALEPRPVRDRAEHAAGLFSLKPVYQWLAGKPHKPLRQELASLISYTTDPGEAAYNTTRHMAGEWLEEQGEERANVIPGQRSNALYYYKQALRYKDQKTAKKFLDEYNRLGGKREGLNQSIKASAPLSMLGKKRRAFLDSLSPQEQEAVRRAEEWYRRVYAR